MSRRQVSLYTQGRTYDEDDKLLEYEVESNIWRQNWDLRDDADWPAEPNAPWYLRNGDHIASEERVTIWLGNVNGIITGISTRKMFLSLN